MENEREKPNFWAVTPATIRYNSKISEFARLLYGEIWALSDKHGYCFSSNPYFARVYEVSESKVSRALAELTTSGYVEAVDNKGGESQRKLIPKIDPFDKVKREHLVKNDEVHLGRSAQHNNTSILTTQDTISKDIVEATKIKLPIKGNSSLQRIINFYSSVWKERYGRYPVSTNYALLGKQLKPTLSLLSEYQLALVVMQYFHWKGTTGSDEFGHKRLVDKAFPLHWVPGLVDEILVYWRNEMGVDPDDEKEVKKVVDQKVDQLQIREGA